MLHLRPDQLAQAAGFDFIAGETLPGVRLTIYEHPIPGNTYVLGADFALGIVGRDKDTAEVLDNTGKRKVQVAELEGTLGERADKLIYALAVYFNGAFVVGERQFGLPSLRRLLREFGYGWLYYERDEKKRARPVTDKLGYFKTGNWSTDPMLRSLRSGIREDRIEIRSKALLAQLSRLQYAPKTSIQPEDALDADMAVKLAGGGSPDLVMALGYAWLGCNEVVHFPDPKPRFRPGSMGDILGHADMDLGDGDQKGPGQVIMRIGSKP